MVTHPLKGKEYITLGHPVTSSQTREGEQHESMNQTQKYKHTKWETDLK